MGNTDFTSGSDVIKGLGIASLILGIITVVLSFIPCFGFYAVYPGLIAIMLSFIAISRASKFNLPKDLAIAGLVCSIIGTSVAAWQWFNFKRKTNEVQEKFENFRKESKEKAENLSKEIKEKLENKNKEIKERMENINKKERR